MPSDKNGKELSEIYCGGCHVYPEPNLLDKKTWIDKLLPNMGARLGIKTPDYDPYKDLNQFDVMLIEGLNTYPSTPKIHPKDWQKIVSYYKESAPDTLSRILPKTDVENLENFKALSVKDNSASLTTMVRFNPKDKTFWIAKMNGELVNYDLSLKQLNKIFLNTPALDLQFGQEGLSEVLECGQMTPNEQNSGKLIKMSNGAKSSKTILEGLKRPVRFVQLDLNNDGQNEIFVSEFGYQSGLFAWYEKKADKWKRHVLSYQSGASEIKLHDFNNDGLKDLMVLFAQGDEHISIYYNNNFGEFREERILSFSPVYGSADIDLVDFNKDGYTDILYTNGDNADFSMIKKPYHGIRLFINDKKNKFTEKWFYPMYGAFRAKAADFDKDGDYDIVATSFFPDDSKEPSSSFVYLEQTTSMLFKTKSLSEAKNGRWMTMDIADADADGDLDILLGSFMLNNKTEGMSENFQSVPFLLLSNTK